MIRYTDINTGNSLLDEGIENYLMRGYKPGGFLTAVLANDLRFAIGRADHWNKDNLPRITTEVFHKVPDDALYSYDAVRDWCRDVDGRRSAYATQKEREYTWRALKGEVKTEVPDDPPF